jgi:hypothetical protein
MPADPVDALREPRYAVDNVFFSTVFLPSATPLIKPRSPLFHVFHTPYDYD